MRGFWLKGDSSVSGRFVNTGEFGAERWPADDAPLPKSRIAFGGVLSRSFDFKSLYAVLTPRLPCLTYIKFGEIVIFLESIWRI